MRIIWATVLVLAAVASSRDALASIDASQAASVFKQAKLECVRDDGRLWGQSICGPMLLVDPEDRAAVANQPDAGGLLRQQGDVWVGTVPETLILSDTTVTWSGTRWCELLWPWPVREDDDMRHVTLAHELFHRVQSGDKRFPVLDGDNRHLDSMDGRYLMEMEWRALAKALSAHSAVERRQAVEDAILFRRERYRIFPSAARGEGNLENNEGIAEYTGVRIGLTSPQEQVAYALRDLAAYLESPTLVRSFAYATGPAWGLLNDAAQPEWRKSFLANGATLRLDERLSVAMHLPDPPFSRLKERESVYDTDGSLRKHEEARDEGRRERARAYQASLIDGPVLRLPLTNAGFQFKPGTLVALPTGTVYPTLRLTDDWGTLTVESGGAFVAEDGKLATVSALGLNSESLAGNGYELVLARGWSIVSGPRSGDYTLAAKK